jgi:hypothetical protein
MGFGFERAGFPQFEGGYGGAVLLAPCGMCGRICAVDPATCPSVLIDPQTGRPPDVMEGGPGGKGVLIPLEEIDPAAVERSRAQPLCPRCIKALNDAYRKLGKDAPFADPDPADL